MSSRSKLFLFVCLLVALAASSAVSRASSETFRNPRRIPLAVDPYGVTAGDLNGDGRNDIVWTERAAYPATPVLHVLLAAASGRYSSAPDVSLPFYAAFVHCIVEDVTGDAQADVVCVAVPTTYTGVFVLTYAGKGDGTFTTPTQTKVPNQSSASAPFLARAGDLNGDGFADVLVMNAYDSNIVPFLSDGKGGFSAAPEFQGSFNYSVPTVTDLNGDGVLDVLWPTGPRVNLGKGDGTFSTTVSYDPGYLSNCAFGDVDGDGHLDAACTWYDGGGIDGQIHLSVLHGNSDGSFAKSALFSRAFGTRENEYDGLATTLEPIFVADLDGDGYPDIVSLSGDGYSVLLGGGNATWNSQPLQFVAASLQSQSGLKGIYGLSLADMNGDGLPDILAVGPNGLYLTYAQRDGTLSSAPAVEVGQVSTSAALADFNGDGNLDVVSAGDTALKLSLGHGDGTFDLHKPVTSSGNFGAVNNVSPSVLSGDFNGDGKQDLFAVGSTGPSASQSYMLFGHGDGTFDAPRAIAISAGMIADLNRDGRDDVFAIQNNSVATNTLVASLSRGDGTFTTVSTILPAEPNGSFIYPIAGPALADYGHSGLLDAAVASFNNAYVLRGNGDGTFNSRATPLPIPTLPGFSKVSVNGVVAGDFDGDGNSDFAVLAQYGTAYGVTASTTGAWIFYGNGDGTFAAAVLAGSFNRATQGIFAGDLDGDGLPDLVLTSYSVYQYNGLLVAHALPNRTWGSEADYTGGEGLSSLWITDINHDGRNDLVVANALQANIRTDSVAVLLNLPDMSATGTLTATPEPSLVGQSITLNALLSSSAGGLLNGTIAYAIDGTAAGSAPLVNGASALSYTGKLSIGTHRLTAQWAGDASNAAVTLYGTHVVAGSPTTTLLTSSKNPSNAGDSVVFTASVSGALSQGPSGTVTITDGSTVLAVVTVGTQGSTATATFATAALGGGSHALSAVYSGDATYAASTGSLIQTVQVISQTGLTLAATPNPAFLGQTITLKAAALTGVGGNPIASGTIQFLDGSTLLGTASIASGVASLSTSTLSIGTHSLSAHYPGDATNTSASSNAVEEKVLASDLTLSASQISVTLQRQRASTFTVKALSIGSFADTLAFTVTSLPDHVTLSFSPTEGNIVAGGPLQSSVQVEATYYLATGMRAVPRSSRWSGVLLGLGLFPLSLLIRPVRRRLGGALAIVVTLAMCMGMSSCTESYAPIAYPGDFTLHLVVTGESTGITRALDIPCTVSK